MTGFSCSTIKLWTHFTTILQVQWVGFEPTIEVSFGRSIENSSLSSREGKGVADHIISRVYRFTTTA
jgi:hypothetical protein